MKSDIEIAQAAKLEKIGEIAAKLDIPEDSLEPFGHYKAKISLDYLNSIESNTDGKLILVTAISPTPAGEGKTTTSVGLGDALNHIGKKALVTIREPSLGPVFGMKGGAAGGGRKSGDRRSSRPEHGRRPAQFACTPKQGSRLRRHRLTGRAWQRCCALRRRPCWW